jgi:hypothetical protein
VSLPRVWADFQKTDDLDRVILETHGTHADLSSQGLQLTDGLRLTLYTDDLDAKGTRDDLVVDGTVRFDDVNDRWVAEIDWAAIRHESELRSPFPDSGTSDEP